VTSAGNGSWGNYSWTYDYVPNSAVPTPGRTALLDQITLGTGGNRDYSFGPAGHLDEIVSGALTSTYQHSPEGQIVDIATLGARSTMTYDGRGFLRRAEKPAFSIFEDGFETGNLDCWSTGGLGCFTPTTEVTTTATYGSEGLLYALQRQTGERHNVLYFAGRPVAQLRVPTAGAAAFTYLTTDHLGTPVLAMNQAGATLWRGGFDPFGNDWNGAAGAAGVFLRFPGQWEDSAWAGVGTAGLSYNLNRWYERGTGRFSVTDPVVRSAELGFPEPPFLYANANPTFLIDPLGLASLKPGAECENFNVIVDELARHIRDSCNDCRGFFRDNFGLEIDVLLSGDLPRVVVRPPRSSRTVSAPAALFNCTKNPTEVQLPFDVCKKSLFLNPQRVRKGAASLYHELAHYADCNSGREPYSGEEGCDAEKACFGSVVTGDSSCS
jgi:RHS repeat-associated protein